MSGVGTSIAHLPADLRKRLSAELSPGERLLFVTQPDWRYERGKLLAIFFFGVFWSMIALTFFGLSLAALSGLVPVKDDSQAMGGTLAWFMFFFSLPFVAIGAALLAAPFLGIRKAKNTAHAITDVRLISVFGGKDAGAESFKLDRIHSITRRDFKDGFGNLSIGYGIEKDSEGDPRPLTADWTGVPDAKRAEAIIREQAGWVR